MESPKNRKWKPKNIGTSRPSSKRPKPQPFFPHKTHHRPPPPLPSSSARPMQMSAAYPRTTTTTGEPLPDIPETSPVAAPTLRRSTTFKKSSTALVPYHPARTSTLHPPPPRRAAGGRRRVLRVVRNVFRTLPIITVVPRRIVPENPGWRVTGTLFGHRRGRVSFVVQENNRCLPTVLLEFPIRTTSFLQDLNAGTVRVALECDKAAEENNDKGLRLLQEPQWTMFCNGKRIGVAFRREATDDDLAVMERLRNTTIGVGVLPKDAEDNDPGNELAFMRAHFERIVGSTDSETFHMMGLSPDETKGPELSIFFVRI